MEQILLLAWILAGLSQSPLPTIEVKSATDMAIVQPMEDALSALTRHVTACVDAGGKPEACRCQDPQDLAALRKAYRKVLQQHPEWKDQLLSYRYVNSEGRNISGTLVMANLRRQLEALKCE
jgi:hypothetical protein